MTSPRSVATMLSLCSSPTSSEDRALLGSNPSAARGTKREGRATHSRSPLHPHAWDQSEKSQGVRGTESPASSAWDALRKAEGARPSCCDNYLDTYRHSRYRVDGDPDAATPAPRAQTDVSARFGSSVNIARMYSRFIRAMFVTEIAFGHAASHS